MKWPLPFPYKAVNLTQNFRLKGSPPPIIFARIIRRTNALQLCRWQFSYRCYGWGATSENRSKIGEFALTRSIWSKISGTRGRSPPIIFAQLVTPMNALQLCPRHCFHTVITAEALRAKIDRNSAIWHQRGHFDPKFQVKGVAPTNNFCTYC